LYKDHALEEQMHGLKALTIDNDCRLIYREVGDKFIFDNIGTHSEVYIK